MTAFFFEKVIDLKGRLRHLVAPVEVRLARCQERVIQSAESTERGLDMLPMSISRAGFDHGPYTTSSHFVTRHPKTAPRGSLNGPLEAKHFEIGSGRTETERHRIETVLGSPDRGFLVFSV